jgi:two-component system response regulator AlgR
VNDSVSQAPLRIFLVDDEAPARARMRELLGDLAVRLPNVVVGEAANGREGVALLPDARPDVALVDVQMPQMSGMELARHLAQLERAPAIVFVTAHNEYAVEAFEVNAIDYLLKPVRAQRLEAALRKAAAGGPPDAAALGKATHGPRRFLSVTERGRILLVPVADIVYMKAELKYVTLRTPEREFLLEESLTSLEQELGTLFVRVHRNCLVARRAIKGFARGNDADGDGAGWAVIVDGCKESLPVSRRQWSVVKQLAVA